MSDRSERNYYRKIIRNQGYRGEECETLVHKVMLIAEIKAIIEANNWSQGEAAKKLGVKQPRIAELNKACVDKFSTDLLIKYLYRLGRLVDVSVVEAKAQSTLTRSAM
jgi:predicted XRE-type DNA-binding protein